MYMHSKSFKVYEFNVSNEMITLIILRNILGRNKVMKITDTQDMISNSQYYGSHDYGPDAPSFTTEGPTQRYVLLGDSLSLLCGTGLDSNPAATINWTAPDMTTIMDNARYDLENGPEIVRLNFTHTISSDTGVWVCEATAVSDKDIVNDG